MERAENSPTEAPGTSVWQTRDLAEHYLSGIRAAFPLAAEQLELIEQLLANHDGEIQRFLDLGAGDGVLAQLVLDLHPASRAVLVDFSQPMLAATKERLTNQQGRWAYVEADLSDEHWLKALPDQASYDAVLSGFCIHHLDHDRKRLLYAEVFDLLNPGGIFLNLDCVSGDRWTDELFDKLFVESMISFEQTRETPRSPDEVRELYGKDDDEDQPLDAQTQCEWLEKIGFEKVDVYFKWLALALFGGIKPT